MAARNTLNRLRDRIRAWQRRMNPSGALLQGAALAFVLQVAGLGLGYIANVIMARVMGAENYGTYSFVLSITLVLASASELAIPLLLVRYIPAYVAAERWPQLRGLLRGGRLVVTAAGLLTAAGGYLVIYAFRSQIRADYIIPLLIGLWTVPVWANMRVTTSVARSFGRIAEAYLPPRVLRPVGLLAAVGLFAAARWKLDGATATLASLVALALIAAGQLVVNVRRNPPHLSNAERVYEKQAWVRVGFPLAVAAGFSILQHEVGILIAGWMLPPAQAGLYAAATRISQLIEFPLLAVNTVALPAFASLYARQQIGELRRVMATSVRWSFLSAATLTFALIALAPFILRILGSEYLQARTETVLLALSSLLATAVGPALPLLSVTDYQRESMIVAGLTTLLSLILTTLGVALWGITGAALAGLVTVLLSGVIQNTTVISRLGVYSSIIFHLFPATQR